MLSITVIHAMTLAQRRKQTVEMICTIALINVYKYIFKDVSFKAKSIALILDTKKLIDHLEQTGAANSTPKGLILGDFKPGKIYQSQKQENHLFYSTTFQNATYSYFLNDLAICQSNCMVSSSLEKNDAWKSMYSHLLNGYESKFKLDKSELNLLNRLILINIIFEFVDFDENKAGSEHFSHIFEYFYLDLNLQ